MAFGIWRMPFARREGLIQQSDAIDLNAAALNAKR
jgi:hypothetical protein